MTPIIAAVAVTMQSPSSFSGRSVMRSGARQSRTVVRRVEPREAMRPEVVSRSPAALRRGLVKTFSQITSTSRIMTDREPIVLTFIRFKNLFKKGIYRKVFTDLVFFLFKREE